MRREKTAELILSMVTPEDIASSTIGDQAEEASIRGAASFWPDVRRTVASQLWRDICNCPVRLVGLALSGLILIPFWTALLVVPFALLTAVIIATLQWLGIMPVIHPAPNVIMPPIALAATAPWIAWLGSLVTYTVAPLFIGYDLARRSSGREIAAALTTIAWSCAFLFLGPLVSTKYFHVGGGSIPLHLIRDLFRMTGAILFRSYWLGQQRHARLNTN